MKLLWDNSISVLSNGEISNEEFLANILNINDWLSAASFSEKAKMNIVAALSLRDMMIQHEISSGMTFSDSKRVGGLLLEDLRYNEVILLLDNVRYHHTNRVKDFLSNTATNITLKFLPPYSSDLNAIEHLWKDIRKDVTHNHLFGNIVEIIMAIANYFINVFCHKEKIKRLCGFIY